MFLCVKAEKVCFLLLNQYLVPFARECCKLSREWIHFFDWESDNYYYENKAYFWKIYLSGRII